MNNYTKEDMEILKLAVKEYYEVKEDIDKEINEGKTIEDIYHHLRHISLYNIIRADFNEICKYIDFNTQYLTLSVIEYDNYLHLGLSAEIWDDKNCKYLGCFNDIKDVEDIIKEEE